MERKKLIILGAIGNCLDIAEAALANRDEFDVQGFLDDKSTPGVITSVGLPVLGGLKNIHQFPEAFFVSGIGSPDSFRSKAELLASLEVGLDRFATVIHPSAVISSTAQIGRGVTILSLCSIGAGVVIGDNVVMLQNCVIGHDSSIGDNSICSAGVVVSGNVEIGSACYIGAGAVIRHSQKIGNRVMLGMGSVVVSDIPSNITCWGVPAKEHLHSS